MPFLDVSSGDFSDDETFRLLRLAARLLVEYNVHCSTLVRKVTRLADSLGLRLQVLVSNRAVDLHLSDGRTIHVQAPEYRLNVAVCSGALRLIDAITDGRMPPGEALLQLESLAKTGPCHSRWVSLVAFGLAASALAGILEADYGTLLIAGLSSALGLCVRQELGKRHWPLFSLPFVAGAIGGVSAGLAIRLGWTETSGLCLVVPLLMLVPGPHLINAFFDILGNYIPSGLCRLVLALGILMSAALGALVGGSVLIDLEQLTAAADGSVRLTLWLDVLLAGIAAFGFGIFYNSPWRVLGISIGCGMIGHGVRYLALTIDAGLSAATFFASTTIGVLAGLAVIRPSLSFSSVAFAAAVPMMPGTLIYRSLGGAVQLSRAGANASAADLAQTIALFSQASLVVGALTLGLLMGAVIATWMDRQGHPHLGLKTTL